MSNSQLYISKSLANSLPSMIKNELINFSDMKQRDFIEEYKRKRKSIFLAYLFWFFLNVLGLHYIYLRKWGLWFFYFITFGGVLIWWIIDLFRTYGMVSNYNKDVATEVMRNLKAIS